MRAKIQERRSYQLSMRWQIHRDYFQSKGSSAFLEQEIPFSVTSNQAAAHQNAQLVIKAIHTQKLGPDQPIRVLELACGLGLFGMNFISAFEEICQQEQLDYAARLEYWMTDFSLKTLREIAANSFYQKRIDQGKLKIWHLDAVEALTLSDLEGQLDTLSNYRFSACIANYAHCALPINLLFYENGIWKEAEVETFAWLAGSPQTPPGLETRHQILLNVADKLRHCQLPAELQPDLAMCLQQAMQQVAQIMSQMPVAEKWTPDLDLNLSLVLWILEATQRQVELSSQQIDPLKLKSLIRQTIVDPLFQQETYSQQQLQEVYHGRHIELPDYCPDPDIQVILQELVAGLSKATVPYPIGSLQCFQRLLPQLLENGLLLISDKALIDLNAINGIHQYVPSIHGDSLAHMVNYPFFQRWFTKQGYSHLMTTDPTASLQVFLACKSLQMPDAIETDFQHLLLDHNANMESQFLLEAGQQLYKHGDRAMAVRLFLRAFKHRSRDSALLINLGAFYLSQHQAQQALKYLTAPHDGYFHLALLAALRADAYRALADYPQAIENYLECLEYEPDQVKHRLPLAQCYIKLEQFESAQLHLQVAHVADPTHPEVQEYLQKIQCLVSI